MPPRKKKSREQAAKADRRSLKSWAKGARESVLAPHVEPFADAIVRGWLSQRNYLRSVCNEFHATINWRLKDFEEPPLPLPPYDPNAMPVEESLTDEEAALRHERIELLNARIRRWLRYRVDILQGTTGPSMDPKKNPYAILLAKLTGMSPASKARQGWQQFMHESYGAKIQVEVEKRWRDKVEEECLAGDSIPNAPFRAMVARQLFNAMSKQEQELIKDRAKAEAAKAKAAYEAALEEKPPFSPAEKQKAIDNLAAFLNPIMRGVEQKTGFKFLLVYGGSTPRCNGEITTGYLAWGENKTNSPCHFPQWAKEDFKTGTLEKWREWLNTAYNSQDLANNTLNPLDLAPYRIEPQDDLVDTSEEEQSESEEPQKKTPPKKAPKKKKTRPPATSRETQERGDDGNGHDDGLPDPPATQNDDPQDAGSVGGGPEGELEDQEGRETPVRKKRSATAMDAEEAEPESDDESTTRPRKRLRSAPYNPINPLDPDGELIPPPDPSNYLDMKAYNTAQTRRAVAGLQEEIRDGFRNLVTSSRPPRLARTRDPPSGTPSVSGDQEGDVAMPAPLSPPPASTATPASTPPTAAPAPASTSAPASSPAPSSRPPTTHPSPSNPSSTSATCPPGAAAWFKKAFPSVSPHQLGNEFDRLLEAYIRIEVLLKYAESRKGLSTADRPSEVALWIKCARKKTMVLEDVQSFSSNWWKWWTGLQPSWRTLSADRPVTTGPYGDDWSSLQFSGPNGFLSVVATLRWWGEAVVDSNGEDKQDWFKALEDVIWILTGLAAALS